MYLQNEQLGLMMPVVATFTTTTSETTNTKLTKLRQIMKKNATEQK